MQVSVQHEPKEIKEKARIEGINSGELNMEKQGPMRNDNIFMAVSL